MIEDGYLTISEISTAKFVEQKSVFYAYAVPVSSEDEVDEYLKQYRKKYYDARHVCYAFCLGADKSVAKSSDNGEPSGTAGRPILGVILSHNLTNVLIVVVRYFGGIKLGTSGLIAAYRMSAESAIAEAVVVEKTEDEVFSFDYAYNDMNNVMSALKTLGIKVRNSSFDMVCSVEVCAPKTNISRLKSMVSDYIIKNEDKS